MPFIFDIPERRQPATQELDLGSQWAVLKGFWYVRKNGEKIFVPPSGRGTEAEILAHPAWTTDYGSIPRIFQNLFSPVTYAAAYILHDWLYCSEKFARNVCDDILFEAIEELQKILNPAPSWWGRTSDWAAKHVVYGAVRAGGWAVWKKHNPFMVQALRDYEKTF